MGYFGHMRTFLRALVAFAILLCLVFSASFCASQETREKTSPPYPDTADGLHSLLTDLLVAAKNDDQSKLSSKIVEMEIPDYENWFTRTFGQEKGQALANGYGKFLKMNESQFELLFAEFSKQDGKISIERVNTAKKYGNVVGSLDEYSAHWRKTDSSAGPDVQSIALFDFTDGEFRLREVLHEVRILRQNGGAPLPAEPKSVVPAKLINRVAPVYPEAARRMRIQGTVALNVVIRKDGNVTVENVGAGHPLLAPPAIAAVQQWKYEPTTVDGEPVDVETKVHVMFQLPKPQTE